MPCVSGRAARLLVKSDHDQKDDLASCKQVLEGYRTRKGRTFQTAARSRSGRNFQKKGLGQVLGELREEHVGWSSRTGNVAPSG